MSKLVIVESPAKAKTISQFLGKEYEVLASFGHIRDLPESADEIPEAIKKKKWARLGVNVEENFEPIYVVPSDKKRHVDSLKKAAKGITELLLATDEDREGESISWHILEILKPAKSTIVKRIVFHEITPEAIQEALAKPRQVDEDLVRAQETRRILDRLYGYTLSPLLWKKVAPKLSAGRVQSVAVRLTVERERERARFRAATYWDLEAELGAKSEAFKAKLQRIDEQRLASGKSFDPTTGELKEKVLLLDESAAGSLADKAKVSKPWTVTKLETSPGQENPPPPFMTSTLQQEANRKLRLPSRKTMQVAQQLYEGIDIGGERIGLITYMRTDSLTLADRALAEAREVIKDLYGAEYLPREPVKYRTKAKGAQEAHEAIRPSNLARRPQDVRQYLDRDQMALYELIWKRTIACQMLPAKVARTSVNVAVEVGSQTLTFGASGKQIVFPGFLKAYVEGSDDPDAELESKESMLPPLREGQILDLKELEAQSHTTRPPARYTEASLVKKLEEEGIGRPSTYASIIGTIQDRGYVRKQGNELIPTFTAFAVTGLLEDHFANLVDLTFTARMENELDEIAEGRINSATYLHDFYTGTGDDLGIAEQVEQKAKDIPFPAIALGNDDNALPVVIRVGRYGTFVQRGEGGTGNTANVPDDVAPAEMTLAKAIEMIEGKAAGPAAVGVDPSSGQCVFYRKGRFGDYLEVAQTDEEKEAGEKPKRVTLPKGLKESDIEDSDLALLLMFPRTVGNHPESGEAITVANGQYGPYVKCGAETRNVEDWRAAAVISLADAVQILSEPKKTRSGRTFGAPTKIEPIKEFGVLEGAAGPVRVLPGRYGPYVTDGTTNATIPKGIDPGEISETRALELLAERAGAGPSKKKGRAGSARSTRTAKPAAKTTAKKKAAPKAKKKL